MLYGLSNRSVGANIKGGGVTPQKVSLVRILLYVQDELRLGIASYKLYMYMYVLIFFIDWQFSEKQCL